MWKAEGEAMGRVLAILQIKFRKVPKDVEKTVRAMVDLTALQSLAVHAESCHKNPGCPNPCRMSWHTTVCHARTAMKPIRPNCRFYKQLRAIALVRKMYFSQVPQPQVRDSKPFL